MRVVVMLVIAVLATPAPSEACSCRPRPAPCEAMWDVDAVFTGKVMKLTRTQDGLDATVAVTETLRGTIATSTVVVTTAGDGAACGVEFVQGASYIVYGAGAGAAYATGLCSGTRPLADAAEDLAYGRAKPRRARAIVEGDVALRTETGLVKQANVDVVARGTPFATRSDRAGHYHLELLPGKYTLDVTAPGLAISVNDPVTVNLPDPAACAARPIALEYDGRIRGRLTDHTGLPIANVLLAAYATGGTKQHWRLNATTDVTGAYEFVQVPPGQFFVSVNAERDGGPNFTQPYPSTFYPRGPSEAKATAVVVGKSAVVDRIDFALPKPLRVFDVTGVVRTKDGSVAPHRSLYIHNATYPGGTSETVDDQGRYKHRAIEGSRLTFRLCLGLTTAKPKCTEVTRLLDRSLVVDLVEP